MEYLFAFFFLLTLSCLQVTNTKDWCLVKGCHASRPKSDGSCSILRLVEEKFELCCKYQDGRVSYKKGFVPTDSYKQCTGTCEDFEANGQISCGRCAGCEKNPSTTTPKLPPTTDPSIEREVEELRARSERFELITIILTVVLIALVIIVTIVSLIFCLRNKARRDPDKAQRFNEYYNEATDMTTPMAPHVHRCNSTAGKEVVTRRSSEHFHMSSSETPVTTETSAHDSNIISQ